MKILTCTISRSIMLTIIKYIAKSILPCKIYTFAKQNLFNMWWRIKKITLIKKRYPSGVNFFCYETQNSGGSITRIILDALNASSIPYSIIDLSNPTEFNNRQSKKIYNVNLICLHAAANTKYQIMKFNINYSHHYNIGYWAWELPEVPHPFYQNLEFVNEFWTISNFCSDALSKKSKKPVLTVPPFSHNKNADIIESGRNHFNIPENLFCFLFVFDCMSFTERKNPDAVIDSFIKIHSQFDNVGLILKYVYPEAAQKYIANMKLRLKEYKNIFYFENYMPQHELKTLLYISDAFISLHRAEGFGLLPLEAMGLGTPVIATEWSGNMEYMNHKNAALVGCRMVPVDGRYVGSTPGDGLMWAEPDVEEAATHMSRMITDEKWRESLIFHGLETAKSLTTEKTGRLMRDRLEFLGLLNPIRH